MSGPRNVGLIVLAAAALASACSLFLNFDPSGQPCNAQGQCISGYQCVAQKCELGEPCPTGSVPGPSSSCLPVHCDGTACAVGLMCVENDGGAASCLPATDRSQLGFGCGQDTDCPSNRVCMRGTLAADATSLAPRPGICVEPCAAGSICSGVEHAACRTFQLAFASGTASFCVPQPFAKGCLNSGECSAGGQVCTLFDNPSLGPVGFCDASLTGGAPAGQSCDGARGALGGICASGLCLPAPVGQCRSLCAQAADCPAGVCTPGEYVGPLGTLRHIPICVGAASVCTDCTAQGNGACGPDAPHCVARATAHRCLSACTPDAGQAAPCAAGFSCAAVAAGFNFCVPVGGGAACQ